MIYYLKDKPNASGAYPAPHEHPGPGTIPISEKQRDLVVEYNGFVTVETKTDETGAVSFEITPNTGAWEVWKAAQPDPLLEAKTARIAQSKADLATYLAVHPLQWTDGEFYAITQEKQNQLTSKIMAATMAQSLSTDYDLTWNSTGEVCKSWTLQDLSALAFAIDKRVTALVSYQQTQEVSMREASTLEELEAIVVDYDAVQ